MIEEFARCVKELTGKSCPRTGWDELFGKMKELGVEPYEYLEHVYRSNRQLVVRKYLVSDYAWSDFVAYREMRRQESALRAQLQQKRLKGLLEDGVDLRKVVESELDTFYALFRYIMASMLEDESLKRKYMEGARYELRTAPELAELFKDFEYDKEALWK